MVTTRKARWAQKVLAEQPDDPEASRLLAGYHEHRGETGLANFYRVQGPAAALSPTEKNETDEAELCQGVRQAHGVHRADLLSLAASVVAYRSATGDVAFAHEAMARGRSRVFTRRSGTASAHERNEGRPDWDDRFDDSGYATAIRFSKPITDPASLAQIRDSVVGRGRRGIAYLEDKLASLPPGDPATPSTTATSTC